MGFEPSGSVRESPSAVHFGSGFGAHLPPSQTKFGAQWVSLVHALRQSVPSPHAEGAHEVDLTGAQVPNPSQVPAESLVSPVQLAGLHAVIRSGSLLQAVRSEPSHTLPLQMSPPPSSHFGRVVPWGFWPLG